MLAIIPSLFKSGCIVREIPKDGDTVLCMIICVDIAGGRHSLPHRNIPIDNGVKSFIDFLRADYNDG